MSRALISILIVLFGFLTAHAYDYPFKDPYVATVLGTLPQDEFPLSSVRTSEFRDLNPFKNIGKVGTRELTLHERPVPDILWFGDTLQYSVAMQPGVAPLLFVIAGTGSSFQSANCRYLQAVFHRAGFHVVALSSTTYVDFIISGSTTQVPGYIPQDVADLYQCMDAIANEIGRDHISGYHLTGYSLGGTQSAFLAELDAREKRFGFGKVLLLNPAVSPMTSSSILDHMLTDNVANRDEAARVVAALIQELSQAYKRTDRVNFGDEFLFALKGSQAITQRELKILIGVAFRLSLANMVFTSDLCTGAGYIVPRGYHVEKSESLTPYVDASMGVTFDEYAKEYLLPFLAFKDSALTPEKAIQASSLEAIAPFLRTSTNVAVMTNADDLILTQENQKFLKDTFGARLTVYPAGGHCGNLRYRDNISAMLKFFLQ